MFPERIETERLELRRISRETVDPLDYYEICSDESMDEVTEYLPWDPHPHPEESYDFIERVEEAWEERERASYFVFPKDAPDGIEGLAGQGGIGIDWDKRTGTLGAWLRKRYWGNGYSGERALALMELAFERLDLELVAVDHQVGNENSRRAIEKYVERAGGRREGRLRNYHADPDGPIDAVRYSVSREEWRRDGPDDFAVTFHEVLDGD